MFFKRLPIVLLTAVCLSAGGSAILFAQQPAAPAPEALPGQPQITPEAVQPTTPIVEANPAPGINQPAAAAPADAAGQSSPDPLSRVITGALGASLGEPDRIAITPAPVIPAEAPPAAGAPTPALSEAEINARMAEANAGLDQMAGMMNAAGGGSTTATAAVEVTSPRIPTGYVGFWYEETRDEDSDTSMVERVQMPGDEYEERKRSEVENVWYPRYAAFLNGNYTYAEPDISQAQAQAMVQVDPETSARMRSDPAFLEDLGRRMAEWTVYYQQLDLWRAYVEDNVLREALEDDERPSFEPSVVESELVSIYERMKAHAQDISTREYEAYLDVIEEVDQTVRAQEDYQEWLDKRQQQVQNFAENWGQQHDGTQVNIDNTLFLVRSPKPQDGQTAETKVTEENPYLPKNAVIIDVPKEKVVTPFDLLNPDGTLKKPVER